MHFLINSVQRGLQAHLIHKLYREDMFGELMAEREDIASKRLQVGGCATPVCGRVCGGGSQVDV